MTQGSPRTGFNSGLSILPLGIALLFLAMLVPSSAFAQAAVQATTEAPLSPEAQAAVKKGLIAAQQQDYLLAVQYFQDARKASPQAPVIFYDLGLAESKLPGRELRAIAWFGAYLAARPDAPNAGAVNTLLAELNIKAEVNRDRLIKSVSDAADQIRPDDEVNGAHKRVAYLWAKAGDMAAATTIVDRMPTALGKVYALIEIARSQVEKGDRAGARRTLLLAQRTPLGNYFSSLGDVAKAQLEAGDVAGALNTAALIEDPYYRVLTLCDVAKAQVDARDAAGARGTIAAALGAVDSIQGNPGARVHVQTSIAEVQVKIGDKDSAKRTLTEALVTVNRMSAEAVPASVGSGLSDVAQGFAAAGDFDSALKTAGQAPLPFRDYALHSIAFGQARQQDVAGAERTDALIQDPSQKQGDLLEVARQARSDAAQASAQSTVSAPPEITPDNKPPSIDEWLSALDNKSDYADTALSSDAFLNLSGALDKLRSMTDPRALFDALYVTTLKIIVAQNTIRGMLARQARPAG